MFHRIYLFLIASLATALARDPMDRPNVVLIYVDDSAYGDYAHNGNPVIETPNITKLAAEGVNLPQFYVTSPACSASRYSLVTGRYPGHSGFHDWVIGPESKPYLRKGETTLADGFKSRGYATGIFGKWHLGTPNPANGMTPAALPLAHGFDTWTGTNVSHDYDDAMLIKSDPAGKQPVAGYSVIAKNLPSNPAATASLTSRYTADATAFIRAHRDQPFFAYITPNQPHLGLFVSDAFKGKSRRGLFGDVMAEIDASVGRVMDTLDECGIAKNTLVIYSSDNGPWIHFQNVEKSKYGEARMDIGYALPFRDGKASNWEGGHRVPGIFRWPGVFAPARQLEPASTLDVLPTLFALCGAKTPGNIDGRDIRPLLSPARFKGAVPPFTLAFSGRDNKPNAWREGPWKIHVALTSQTGTNYGFTASRDKPLLFNVEQDPGERFDRAAEHPEIVKRLLGHLDAASASIAHDH